MILTSWIWNGNCSFRFGFIHSFIDLTLLFFVFKCIHHSNNKSIYNEIETSFQHYIQLFASMGYFQSEWPFRLSALYGTYFIEYGRIGWEKNRLYYILVWIFFFFFAFLSACVFGIQYFTIEIYFICFFFLNT